MTNETLSDPLCISSCIEDLKYSGPCSYVCFKLCPTICKIVLDLDKSIPPPPVTSNNLKKISVISALSITSALFLLFVLFLCFKWYNKRRSVAAISRRRSIEEGRNSDFSGPLPVIIDHPIWHIRTIGLSQTVISSIKVCKYSKQDGVVEGTDCSVCLSEFEEEETLRLLPRCKHAFHLSCIDTWFRSHTNCPLCRAPILVINTVNDDEIEDLEEILVTIPEENGEIERDHVEDADDEAEESEQRVRRSVSLDSLRVSETVAGKGKEKMKRSNTGSSTVGKSTFFNRSISYNGK